MRMLVLATQLTEPDRGDPAPMALLLRALVESGREVHLVCADEEPIRSHENLTVHPVHEQRAGLLPAFAPRALEAAKSIRPGCVLAERAHLPLAWTIAARMGAMLVPVLTEPPAQNSPWSLGLAPRLANRFVRNADACLTCGPSQADEARQLGAARVFELPGVTSLEDGALEPTGWLRRHIGIEEGVIAVSWGELSPEHGTDVFIEGVKVAADADADIHAVILGGNDESIDRYEAKAQRLGIEQRVHLLGSWPAQKLGMLLAEADIIVEADLAANRTPEAFYTFLGAARPVILSEVAGRHRLAVPESCLFAPPDRLGMGHVLAELTSSEDLRARFGAAGRACVDQAHTYTRFRTSLDSFDRVVAPLPLGETGGPEQSKGLRA